MSDSSERIADAAREAAKKAIAAGALEQALIPERVYTATLAAALEEETIHHQSAGRDRPGKVSARHGTTSRAAALRATPRTGTDRRKVLDLLVRQDAHGATRDELVEALHMNPNTLRPRVAELIEGGFVIATDRTRPTASGDPAEVLIAVPHRLNHDVPRDSSRDLPEKHENATPAPALFAPSRSPYDPEV